MLRYLVGCGIYSEVLSGKAVVIHWAVGEMAAV